MHVTKTETKWVAATSTHGWRWVCATCGAVGEWVWSPGLAERQAIAHTLWASMPALPGEPVDPKP